MARNEWTAQSDIYRVRRQKILQITFGVWICRDLWTIWWSQKVCRDFFKRQYKIWFTSYCTILCSGRVYMGTYCEFLMCKFSSSVTGKSKIQFESIYVFLSQIRKCCKLLAFCQNIFVLKHILFVWSTSMFDHVGPRELMIFWPRREIKTIEKPT